MAEELYVLRILFYLYTMDVFKALAFLPSFLSSLQVAGQQVYNSLSDRNASMALGGAGKGEGTFGAIKLPTLGVL